LDERLLTAGVREAKARFGCVHMHRRLEIILIRNDLDLAASFFRLHNDSTLPSIVQVPAYRKSGFRNRSVS
jgi:hypothetical protein